MGDQWLFHAEKRDQPMWIWAVGDKSHFERMIQDN